MLALQDGSNDINVERVAAIRAAIASGQLKIPPRIDYLYVEQEVMADDTPAVDAVLRADK